MPRRSTPRLVTRLAGALLSLPLVLCGATVGAADAVADVAPAVRRFGVEHGLSHNAVHAIAQDAHGFLWLGTQDGLNRFDGVAIESIEHSPTDSEASPFITALLADSGTRLWVGSRRGLSLLQRNRDPQAVRLGESDAVHHVTALSRQSNQLWIATQTGLYRLALEAPGAGLTAVLASRIPAAPIRALAAAPDGGVWAIAGEVQCQAQHYSFKVAPASVADGSMAGPAELESGWPIPCAFAAVPLPNGGLQLGPGAIWHAHQSEPLPAEVVLPWVVQRHGDASYFAGLTGVTRERDNGTPQTLWPLAGSGRPSPLGLEVKCMLLDRDGALWLGTYDGLYQLDPHAPRFEAPAAGEAAGRALAELQVSSVLVESERLLIGTFGAGVYEWDLQAHRLSALLPDIDCPSFIWNLAQDSSNTTVANGACSVHGERLRADRFMPDAFRASVSGPQPVSGWRNVRDVRRDSDGVLWLASLDGLWREQAGVAERVLEGTFGTLAIAQDRSIWLAKASGADFSRGNVLRRFEPDSRDVDPVILDTHEDVFDLLVDETGVWAATGAGLLHVAQADGTMRNWVPAGRDAGRVFYSLLRAQDGAIWIGSNRGLLRFDPHAPNGGALQHFDHRDGLEITGFNRRARWQDAQGRFWFGGMNGVVRFRPDASALSSLRSQVLIERIRATGREGDRTLSAIGGAITLRHDDFALGIAFVAPGFRRAHRFVYRYRLLGLDERWVGGASRIAQFSRLAPGDYRFEVEAGDEFDPRRFGRAALDLQVPPPWYASAWFRLAAAAVLLVLVWLGYRLRVAHLLALERMRLSIATDLHDELGSELAAIGVGVGMVERSSALGTRERQRLAGISRSALAVSLALRDLVWVVNPDKDRLAALVDRMRSFSHEILAQQELHFVASDAAAERAIPMALRHDVYLIFKEAIGNIVHHASARRVDIDLLVQGDELELRIEDDGVGFVAGQREGTGLRSMQRRAAALGGRLQVDSVAGHGTRLCLTVQMTRMRPGSDRYRSG